MLMTPKRIVHEGGVVARDAFESKGINDRLGLKPILLTLESDHDVLLAQETLARVRKLSRNTPALQFNIATTGRQQVNVTK
jgi:hypothetical protein